MQEISKRLESIFIEYSNKVQNELKSAYNGHAKKKFSDEDMDNLSTLRNKIMAPLSSFLDFGLRLHLKMVQSIPNQPEQPQEQKQEQEKESLLGFTIERKKSQKSIHNFEPYKKFQSFKEEVKISNRDSYLDIFNVEFPKISIEQIYLGFVDDGEMDGFGTWTDGNSIYMGEWKNGLKHGHGIYVYNNGNVFRGEFKQNKECVGLWTFPGGDKFYGYITFKNIEANEIDYMIGKLDKDNNEDFFTCLYVNKKRTQLHNIAYDNKISIPALQSCTTGESNLQTMRWLNGME